MIVNSSFIHCRTFRDTIYHKIHPRRLTIEWDTNESTGEEIMRFFSLDTVHSCIFHFDNLGNVTYTAQLAQGSLEGTFHLQTEGIPEWVIQSINAL